MSGRVFAAALAAAATALVLAGAVLRRLFFRFQSNVLTYLRDAHPDVAIVRVTPTEAVVGLGGATGTLDLARLFRASRGRLDPAALDRMIDEVRAALPAPVPPPFGLVRDRLLPLLKPRRLADLYARYAPPLRLLSHPFPEGLVVVYAVEGVHQVTYVTEGMRAAWGVAGDEIHALALANLRRRTGHVLEEIGGPRVRYDHLDGFDASRILVADQVTPPEVNDPIVAVPDEHLLLIAPARDAPLLARQAAAAFAAADAPLTPAIFRPRSAPLAPDVLS